MNQQKLRPHAKTLRILQSGDPHTAFHRMSPADILLTLGPPRSLLGTSSKTEKSRSVGVLTRILYFTPGLLCPAATPACLRACLGHSSGRMMLPSSRVARDRRSAFYLERPGEFLKRLGAELTLFLAEAHHVSLQPAARLNGTSDVPWELLHPDIFESFPDIQFFDYTKIRSRMRAFLSGASWPKNYHLTFSLDQSTRTLARRFLSQGGTVAAVFWPFVPSSWLECPVIDGDRHDARFLDPKGSVVGLLAKGAARVDLEGFTVRICPSCVRHSTELRLLHVHENTHRITVHVCPRCGFMLRASWLRSGLSSPRQNVGGPSQAA